MKPLMLTDVRDEKALSRFRRAPRTSLRLQKPTVFPVRKQPASDLDFRAARIELIRVAAYYRAEKRRFIPGAELGDWLAAEAEIDARLNE
jgi:hypothetical protein